MPRPLSRAADRSHDRDEAAQQVIVREDANVSSVVDGLQAPKSFRVVVLAASDDDECVDGNHFGASDLEAVESRQPMLLDLV